MNEQRWRTRLAGLVGLAGVVAAVGVTLGIYQKAFVDSVDVDVTAGRAGLLLDKGSKVKAFGLPVGEVRGVELQKDRTVLVHLAIDKDQAGRIPAGVTADVGASTVFGSKFVELQVPPGAVTSTISSGDVIAATSVTTEVNDVFGSLQEVLTAVDPAQLNATLTSVARALDGRGAKLGSYLSQLNGYVTALNEHTGPLTQDIQRGADVLGTYADVAPDVIDIVRDGSRTSRTVAAKRTDLHRLLSGFTSSAVTGTDLAGTIEKPLHDVVSRYRPVTDLGAEYSPELTCTVQGLANHRTIVNRVFGHYPGIQGLVSLLPGQSGYTYPKNLPKLSTGAGPNCFSLPEVDTTFPGRHHIDDGSDDVYRPGGAGATIPADPVTVYTDLVDDFFGHAGLAELLKSEGG